MGSSFSYEDLAKRSLKKDKYKLLKEDEYEGQECYLLEATSNDKSEKIVRRELWIRKDNFVVVKAKHYGQDGKLLKTLLTKGVKKIQGIWVVTLSQMKNLEKDSQTFLKLSEIKFNTGLRDNLFKKENLK